jgi:hypothetical protein
MPQIIPLRDLKNMSELSELCRSIQEPVLITKNGYGDMVIIEYGNIRTKHVHK